MATRGFRAAVLAAMFVAIGCGDTNGDATPPADDAVDPDATCAPACDGTGCGDDGCGGTCSCATPATCRVDLTCCVPACDGLACGDDGCGGTCGSCGDGTACFAGLCCTPSCEGTVCGDDGCGGSCGTCDEGLECRWGSCREPCTTLDGFDANSKAISASWKPKGGLGSVAGLLTYQESNSLHYPVSMLRFEVRQYSPFKGPTQPGTYAIEDKDYASCSLCATMYQDCDMNGCKKIYLATEGTVEISSLDGASHPLAATLKNVVFKEATIYQDWSTQWTPGGARWCMSDHALGKDNVQLTVPQPQCVAEGTGTTFDTNIKDIQLTNCVGAKFSLHSLCAKKKAIWLLLVTEWCPICAEEMPQAQAIQEANPDKLQLMTIIGEDKDKGPPTAETCMTIAKLHGLNPHYTFYDEEWKVTMDAVYPYGFQGIPYNIALDGDNMAYYWATGAKGDIGTAITDLMNDKN